jgi:hypothetical protein
MFQERDYKNINQNHPSQTEVTETSISNQMHFHYATLRCIPLQVSLIFDQLKRVETADVGVSAVCDRSSAGNAGSKHVAGIDACLSMSGE